MSAAATDSDLFNLKRDYVFIPAGLLVVGTFILKKEWTVYAIVLAIAFGTYNYYALRESGTSCAASPAHKSRHRADS